MESRRAYTAGSLALLTASGEWRRVPAGACWIDRDPEAPDVRTVRWSEKRVDYGARLSGEDLRTYILGCIIQYA
jgi:hypothetical protein